MRTVRRLVRCHGSGMFKFANGNTELLTCFQSSYCPEAAELYAPCVCSKSYVVDEISETIRKSVKYSCSNNDDVTSAHNFYNEYCAMNEGTTYFAPPNGPPGDSRSFPSTEL